jgi:hypothetical protein
MRQKGMSSMKETVRGHALDVIVIATDDGESFGSSEFHVIFDTIVRDNINDDNRLFVELHVNQQRLSPSTVLMKPPATYNTPWTFAHNDSTTSSTKLHCDTWKQLVQDGILQYGRNHIRFLLFRRTHRCNGENEDSTAPILLGSTDACIYLWKTSDRFVITDIDGTITKSNVVGVWDTIITEKYRHVHHGTCRFFSHILSNNTHNTTTQLRILYLSSRPSFLIESTRRFINSLQQEQQQQQSLHHSNPEKNAVHGLPDGPIILQPKSLWSVIAGEIIHKNSFLFKIHALQNYIIQPWYDADAVAKNEHVRQDYHPHASFLFVAAFGNTTCDYMAYRQVGIGQSNIFIIDEKSVIQSWREEQVEEENSATTKSITVEQDDDNSTGVFQACMGKMILFRSRVQSKYYIPIAEYQGYPELHQVILQNNSFHPP